jgi:hypothetical protein
MHRIPLITQTLYAELVEQLIIITLSCFNLRVIPVKQSSHRYLHVMCTSIYDASKCR